MHITEKEREIEEMHITGKERERERDGGACNGDGEYYRDAYKLSVNIDIRNIVQTHLGRPLTQSKQRRQNSHNKIKT